MDALFSADGACTNAGNAAAGAGLAKALAGVAGDARAQALHFRAFLMNPCLVRAAAHPPHIASSLCLALVPLPPCWVPLQRGKGEATAGELRPGRSPPPTSSAFLALPSLAPPQDFNPLFSGNGMTYTGFGGMLAPLGSEYISSAFEVSEADRASIAQIPFCITGTNGGKPSDAGVCELPAAASA